MEAKSETPAAAGQELAVGGTATVTPRKGQRFQVTVPGRVARAQLERALRASGAQPLEVARRGRLFRAAVARLLSGPGDAEARRAVLSAQATFAVLAKAAQRLEPVSEAMGRRAREIGEAETAAAAEATLREVTGLGWEARRAALLDKAVAGELGAYRLLAVEIDLELAAAAEAYGDAEASLAGGYQPLAQALADHQLWQDLFAVEAVRRFLAGWSGLDRAGRPLPALAHGPDGLVPEALVELLSDGDLQALAARLNALLYLREGTAKN
ncbi:MAG: hypothetical protein WD341_06060 [Tistlia sp.]|uniref:hypothetical protein n=1 Tax=Tistlia sp. TaxID=3057121 RepID=UPI0034A56804